MTEAVSALPKFTTVKYTAKDGENITATKNNGVVTLVGEKSGVRQMPVEEFIKNELPKDGNKVVLEKSPDSDTVIIKNKSPEASAETKEKEEIKPQTQAEAAPAGEKKTDKAPEALPTAETAKDNKAETKTLDVTV